MAAGQPTQASADVRVADLAAGLSLATDLGMGFPWEHGLQSTAVAMRLCDLLGVDSATRRSAYYLTMLFYSGCSSDAAEDSHILKGVKTPNIVPYIWGTLPETLRGLLRALPDPDARMLTRMGQRAAGLPRAMLVLKDHQRAYCDVPEALSQRLGLPAGIARQFFFITDHWDGSGVLGRARGEDIPLAVRIAFVARDGTFLQAHWGAERAREALAARGGKAHDPDIVQAALDPGADVFAPVGAPTILAEVLGAEPGPPLRLEVSGLDLALSALGDFADLISPSLAGHSSGVSLLAGEAAEQLGMGDEEVTLVRRAALVQDVGRVGVDPAIWEKQSALTADEREQVRLHPYLSERVLSAVPPLAGLAEPAVCHHERLDGSGYHRSLPAPLLTGPARLLAAADAYRALTQPRPYRPALPRRLAAERMREDAGHGRLDADAVAAVLEVAGQAAGPIRRPYGLTRREAQVLGLLARGMATKQVATTLKISPKTADRHIQHVYRKIGVSSRAAAALVAMQHGLVAWGELPIGEGAGSP